MVNLAYEIFKIIVVVSVFIVLLKLLHGNIKELKTRVLNINTWFFISLIIFTIFIVPYSMNITLSGYVVNPSTNGGDWLGFWGSFLGGILGTFGVIYVARVQYKQQEKILDSQIEEQRQQNKFNRIQAVLINRQEAYNRYLLDLANYREIYIDLAEYSNDELQNISYLNKVRFLEETDKEIENTKAYIMHKKYNLLMRSYNILKVNFQLLNSDHELPPIDNEYLMILEIYDEKIFKEQLNDLLNAKGTVDILESYITIIDVHYEEITKELENVTKEISNVDFENRN